MAKWTITCLGHDDQGYVQYRLGYNGKEIGTDTLSQPMDLIMSDGQDSDTIEERHGLGVVYHYTVANEREHERKWLEEITQTNEAAGEGG